MLAVNVLAGIAVRNYIFTLYGIPVNWPAVRRRPEIGSTDKIMSKQLFF